MDESQLPSILSWLKNKFTGEPPTPKGQNYTASPRLNYPTDEDVNFARKYDYSYGQPWAPEFENKSARLLTGDPNAILKGSPPEAETISTQRLKNEPRADALKDYYAKAALASEGNALAKLGFDPSKTAADIVRDPSKVNLVGVYSPKSDQIYANVLTPSAIVHESIHRGINKLRGSPFWQQEFNQFATGMPSNEMLVRHLMQTQMGDPEQIEDRAMMPSGTPPEKQLGLRQQDSARRAFDPSKETLASDRLKTLRKMEEAAANYIAAKHPGGPR